MIFQYRSILISIIKLKMSKKRYINDNIWEDNYIIDLNTSEKMLFIYLLTNNRVSICWVYEISIRKIEMETWISNNEIIKILKKFESWWKIYYKDWIILISNFIKNQSLNDNMKKWIERELLDLWWEKLSTFIKTKGFERLWKALDAFDIPYLTLLNFTLLDLTWLDACEQTKNYEIIEEWKKPEEIIPVELNEYQESIRYLKNIDTEKIPEYAISHNEEWIKFCYYWSEKWKTWKIRAEWEKTFELKRRFATWMSRKKEDYQKTQQPKRWVF